MTDTTVPPVPGSAPVERPVYLVDGARTPFLRVRGRPNPFTPVDLAVAAGRALLLRQPFAPDELDEVILGCVNPIAEEVNPARIAALRLGCGDAMPAWTVQRNCGSGMQSIDAAYHHLCAGRGQMILAGGAEALSHAPLIIRRELVEWLGEWRASKQWSRRIGLVARLRPRFVVPEIGLLKGLTDPVVGLNMGQTAEVLAHEFCISREAADDYALESHRRLARAQAGGWLDEVAPLYDRSGNVFETDDGVRPDSNREQLAALRPVFERPFGSVTAGNSSQISDGACWVILASEEAVARHGLDPLARIVDSEWRALDPRVMGLGPVLAATPILQRRALELADIGAWELNAAFAAQVLACLGAWADDRFCRDALGLPRALGSLDRGHLNVDGGAISLGHPVGASGARIVLHLAHVLRRQGYRLGVATQCVGGGQGGAMLLETP